MRTREEKKAMFDSMMEENRKWAESPEGQADKRAREENVVLRRQLFDQLEEEFSDQGLKIFSWGGYVPTQGYGKLGDDYWYFRFRHNHATLRVGPYVDEIEEASYQRRLKQHEDRLAADPDDPFLKYYRVYKDLEVGDVYPTKVTRLSAKEGPEDESEYFGDMTDAQMAHDYLKALLLGLEPAPEGVI